MDRENAALLGELADCCRLAYTQKLVGGTGGNLSVRVGDEIYITATGCRLGDVVPAGLVCVGMDGAIRGEGTPSKELGLHLAVYKARPDAAAIVHLHPANSVLVSILAEEGDAPPMPGYTAGYLAKIGRAGLVPNLEPGSPALARALGEASKTAKVVLMRNHGITVAGASPKAALSLAEEAEENARLHLTLQGRGAMG